MLRQEGDVKALVQRDITGRERAEAEEQIRERVCLERWWRKTGNWITEMWCGLANKEGGKTRRSCNDGRAVGTASAA